MKPYIIFIAVLLISALTLQVYPLSRGTVVPRYAEMTITGKTKAKGKDWCGCPTTTTYVQYNLRGQSVDVQVPVSQYDRTAVGDTLSVPISRMRYVRILNVAPLQYALLVLSIVLTSLAGVTYVYNRARTVCTRYRVYQVGQTRYHTQRRILGSWETLNSLTSPEMAERSLADYLAAHKARVQVQTKRYVKNINVDFVSV